LFHRGTILTEAITPKRGIPAASGAIAVIVDALWTFGGWAAPVPRSPRSLARAFRWAFLPMSPTVQAHRHLAATFPTLWVRRLVEHRENNDGFLLHNVEYAEREATSKNPANLAVKAGVELRSLLDESQRGINLHNEAMAETLLSALVPVVCSGDIAFSLGPDGQPPAHRPFGIRALTSGQGGPALRSW
jgi:hypothetical protein